MLDLPLCPSEGKPSKTQPKNKRKVARRRASPEAALEGATPFKSADDETVSRGRDAWDRRKADKASWDDWLLIGEALVIGRKDSLSEAHTSSIYTKMYRQYFSVWLKDNGFDDIDSADRLDLFRIMDSLVEIQEWRAGLTEEQQAKWNHPSTVWRISRCDYRGLLRLRPEEPSEPKSDGSEAITPDDGEADEHGEIVWQRGLLQRANRAIGDAQLYENWLFDEPPDPLLIAQVGKAADAWRELADYLKSIANASPEEFAEARESYARTRELRKEHKEKKEAKEQASVGVA